MSACRSGEERVEVEGREISFIRYNPAGPDTAAKLNKEYVTIHNTGKHAKALTGWRLHGNQHHRYTVPSFTLCGGCSVRVHTGHGTNGGANLYWARAGMCGTTRVIRRRSSRRTA